ncbi:hypothetical protein KKI23_02575, partial [Patescibacteria group bacterium]|nr:hypothetical protein [Patescibacteria group bacterium]
IGSGGKMINKLLGVYSYIAMIGIASGNAVIPLLYGQAVLTGSINLYDLWRAVAKPAPSSGQRPVFAKE